MWRIVTPNFIRVTILHMGVVGGYTLPYSRNWTAVRPVPAPAVAVNGRRVWVHRVCCGSLFLCLVVELWHGEKLQIFESTDPEHSHERSEQHKSTGIMWELVLIPGRCGDALNIGVIEKIGIFGCAPCQSLWVCSRHQSCCMIAAQIFVWAVFEVINIYINEIMHCHDSPIHFSTNGRNVKSCCMIQLGTVTTTSEYTFVNSNYWQESVAYYSE